MYVVREKITRVSKIPWTTPEGMLENSEGLPPPPTVPVPRPMKISLRTESLTADELEEGFPATRMRDVNGAADETISC